MKKIFFFLFAVSLAYTSLAQELRTGPKGKNYIFGKSKKIKFTLVQQDPVANLKGPKAKNYRPWEKKSPAEGSRLVRKGNDTNRWGKTKNANPWDPRSPKTNSKASYVEPKSMKQKKRWFH